MRVAQNFYVEPREPGEELVVAVVDNSVRKSHSLFTVAERVDFIEQATAHLECVRVMAFSVLVVDFAREHSAKVIVKGLRVISDFEWELQMNQLNRTLAPDIETVYVMASPEVSFVSSSGVKEIAAYGGDVEALVPEAVAARLEA